MAFQPDFSKDNPYEGAPPDYIDQIRDTQAYNDAVARGWIQPSSPAAQQPSYPEGYPSVPTQQSATITGATIPIETGFKPDFSKDNPYEGAPTEYLERIYGTQAYETAVQQEWAQPLSEEQIAVANARIYEQLNKYPDIYTAFAQDKAIVTQAQSVGILTDQQYNDIQGFVDNLDNLPQDLQEAFKDKGIDGYNKEVGKIITDFEIALENQPQELQEAYQTGGMEGYSKAFNEMYQVLGDGKSYMLRSDLDAIKMSSPELYDVAVNEGFDAYIQEINKTRDELKQYAYPIPADVLASGTQAIQEYAKNPQYNINSYLIDTRTENGEISPASIMVLQNAGYTPEQIVQAQDYAKAMIESIDYIDSIMETFAGRTGSAFGEGAQDVMVLETQARRLGLLQVDTPGTVAYASGGIPFVEQKANIQLVNPQDFWNSLTDEQKQNLAEAVARDPSKSSYLASLTENMMAETPKYAPLAIAFVAPMIGMPLLAAQTIMQAVTPYTISDEAVTRQIKENTGYLRDAFILSEDEGKALSKAMRDNGIKVKGSALEIYRNLPEEQKQKVTIEYTRLQLGINPSIMANVMAGAMVVASAIPYVAPVVSKLGMGGRVALVSTQAGVSGLFIASSIPVLVSPKTSLEDKIVAAALDALMIGGLYGTLKGLTVDTTRETKELANRQSETLEKMLRENKDYISREVIRNPEDLPKAIEAYDNMVKSVREYAETSLELKKVQRVISEVGLAKTGNIEIIREGKSLDLAEYLKRNPDINKIYEERGWDAFKLELGKRGISVKTTGEIKLIEELMNKESELVKKLESLRQPLEQSVTDFNNIIRRNIKFSEPEVIKEIDDMPKTVKDYWDSATEQIVSKRNALDIARDIDSVSSQIKTLEESIRNIGDLSLDQINSTESLISGLKNQIVDLYKEARIRYLAFGEEIKTTSGGDLTMETKSLQSRLIEANTKLQEFRESNLPYEVYRKGELTREIESATIARDIFESLQRTYEPIAKTGRVSYEDVLSDLNRSLDTLYEQLKSNGISPDDIVEPSLDIIKGAREGNIEGIKSGTEKLLLEAGKLPENRRVNIDEQIKLLSGYGEDLVNMFKTPRRAEPVESDWFFKVGEGEVDYGALKLEKIQQEAQRIVDKNWQKMTEKLPDNILRRPIEQIREYLNEILGKDYVESQLDIGRIEEQIRIEVERQERIQKIKRDIEDYESGKELVDRFREDVKNPERKEVLEKQSEVFEKQIKEKKADLKLAEKEKLTIPLEKTISPEEAEKLPKPAVVEERTLEERIKQREAEEKAKKAVSKAEKELQVEKEREALKERYWWIVPIEERTPRQVDAQKEWEREYQRAMPAYREKMLQELGIDVTEAISPYIKTGTIPEIINKGLPLPIEKQIPQEITKTTPIVVTKTEPITIAEIEPIPEVVLKEEIIPITDVILEEKIIPIEETIPVPPIIPPVKKPTKVEPEEKKQIVENPPPGTFVWIQGRPTGGAMFKVLPPPYRKENFFTTRDTPAGYNDEGWSGEGSAKESLKVIGGLPSENVNDIDLGWARVNLHVETGKPVIEYVHDEDANVGERSKTVGFGRGQIPIEAWEEAKAEGQDYASFSAAYKGKLVGENGGEMQETEEVATTETAEPEEVEGTETESLAEESAGEVENEPESIEDALQGKPIIEEETPATVVQSYIRRKKKPANYKDWWESDYYDNIYSQPTRRNAKEASITERTYLGHRLLPPDLGGNI